MRRNNDDEELHEKIGFVIGDRLTNALRETFIADIGLDHVPVDRIADWMKQFDGIEDYNGLSFIHSELVALENLRFTITGVGTVENPTVHKWLNKEGFASTFSFQIESHGRRDELGNLPLDVWPEYVPYGMSFRPLE